MISCTVSEILLCVYKLGAYVTGTLRYVTLRYGDGTPFNIRAEWSTARRRGHSGLTQRTSAVYAI